MKPVWIIDDDRSIRWVLEKALTRENIEFKSFATADDALRALNNDLPQVVVSDIRMPGSSGLDFLQALHQRHPHIPAIIMTAYSDLESAVSAFQGGAFEYLPKPFDINHAVELIRRALEQSQRKSGEAQEVEAATDILGHAPAMQEVFRAIGKLAQSQATVLINGESGTGKELVARALHRHSPRAGKPFIAINTAAIPKDLLESELFGHERGAFTGADRAKPGLFEVADGGTIFLDEIGEVSQATQVKLLRVLDTSTFRHVGGTQEIRVDVRVLAATNRDLEAMVRQGLFREDLYYRLSTITVTLPPLRSRGADVDLLARHFVETLNARFGVRRRLGDETLARLRAHDWPGNVRELLHVIERAIVVCEGNEIRLEHLPASLGRLPAPAAADTGELPSLADLERTHIERVLRSVEGHRGRAASILGISERNLYRKIRDYGLPR